MSVIIVGGGITGATLALAISSVTQNRLPVTLIEREEPGRKVHPGYDSRALALADNTCRQLAKIKIWSDLSECVTPITKIQVNDRGRLGAVSIEAREYGLEALGQVIELHDVGVRLFRLLRRASGIRLCCPASVLSVERSLENVRVWLDDGELITGKLLIAADGSDSSIAAACGITWHREAYGQQAVVATVSTELPNQGCAFERFTEGGPLALLPMSQNRCAMVWCQDKKTAFLEEETDTAFLDRLQRTFGWRLGRFTQVGKRLCYPLTLKAAHSPISHRLALVGNAAQTLHPIAGQGFNLGFRDIMSLAETLAEAHCTQQDMGEFSVLESYRQRRVVDQQATLCMTNGLTRLFSTSSLPLVIGRNLGLLAMNNLPFLRHTLAKRALGWTTD